MSPPRPEQITMADTNATARGMTRDEYEAAVTAELQEAIANPISIRTKPEGLAYLVQTGKVPTIFNTGEFRLTGDEDDMLAPTYLEERRLIEKQMFGIPDDAPPSARPTYGYFDSPLSDREALSYGDIVLHLREDIKSRTTFTARDLFYSNGQPSYVEDPSPYSVIGTSPKGASIPDDVDPYVPWNEQTPESRAAGAVARADPLNWQINSEKWMDNDFIEAQMHGGVNLADIEAVSIPEDMNLDQATLDALAQAGVRVDRIPSGTPAGVPGAAPASDGAPVEPAPDPASPPVV